MAVSTARTLDDYVDAIHLSIDGTPKVLIREVLAMFTKSLQTDIASLDPGERIVVANLGVFSGIRRAARPAVQVSDNKTITATPPRKAAKWRPHEQIRAAFRGSEA